MVTSIDYAAIVRNAIFYLDNDGLHQGMCGAISDSCYEYFIAYNQKPDIHKNLHIPLIRVLKQYAPKGCHDCLYWYDKTDFGMSMRVLTLLNFADDIENNYCRVWLR